MIYAFILYLKNTAFYRDQYHTNTEPLIEIATESIALEPENQKVNI